MARKSKKVVIAELRADVSGFRADFNNAVKAVQSAQGAISRVMGTIGTVIKGALAVTAVKVIYDFGKSLATITGKMAEAGDRVNDLRAHFASLGGTSESIKKAQDALLGTVTAVDLMSTANKGLLKNIPGFNQHFGQLAELAGRASEALGIDAKTALDTLVDSLVRGKKQGLEKFGLALGDVKGKAEIAQKAFEQLPAAIARLEPMSKSAGQAYTTLTKTIEEGKQQTDATVDSNINLQQAYTALSQTMKTLDWEEVGRNLADISSILVNLANTVLPFLINRFNELNLAIEWALGTSTRMKFIETKNKIEGLKGQLAELTDDSKFKNLPVQVQIAKQGARSDANIMDLKRQIVEQEQMLGLYTSQLQAAAEAPAKIKPVSGTITASMTKEIEKSIEGWNKLVEDNFSAGIVSGMQAAIKNNDIPAFEKYKTAFKEMTKEGILKGLKESIGKPGGPESLAQAEAEAEKAVERIAGSYDDQMTAKSADIASDLENQLKDAFQQAQSFWEGIWSEFISTGTLDFSRMLQDVAVQFASTLTAGLLGGPGVSNIGQLGTMFAQQLLGGGTGGAGGLLNSALGIGGGLGIGQMIGAWGAANSGTWLGGAAMGLTGTAGPAASAAGASGMAIGAQISAAMPYVAAAVGAYMIADHFGLFGDDKQHPETQARDDVEGWLEEKMGRNFIFGKDDRFNNGKGFEFYDTMSQDQQALYTGFGSGLTALLGITEDVGAQIGVMLAENIGGGIDEAKMLFKELGISAEEMAEAVIKAGLEAGLTWKQINDQLTQIDKLATPGLEGHGDVAGAVNEIINSAGEGMDAIIGLQDLVIEAMQGGFESLDELGAELKKTLPADQVAIIIQALADAGVSSMADLENASMRTLISIIARLEELGLTFAEVDSDVQRTTESMREMADSMPDTGAGLSGNSSASNEPRFASGGVVFGPTHALVGEAGPEAILPLSRIGGRLGIRGFAGGGSGGNPVVINIDARYADAGVEDRIMAAIEAAKEEAVGVAINAVDSIRSRGGGLTSFDR